QAYARDAAGRVRAVLERDRAAVVLDDLARQHEPDAATAGLGREERHPEIVGAGEPRAVVLDLRDERALLHPPAYAHAPFRAGSLDGVLDQVDQHLLDLIGVDLEQDGRRLCDLDALPVQRRGAPYERAEVGRAARRPRQAREPRICT